MPDMDDQFPSSAPSGSLAMSHTAGPSCCHFSFPPTSQRHDHCQAATSTRPVRQWRLRWYLPGFASRNHIGRHSGLGKYTTLCSMEGGDECRDRAGRRQGDTVPNPLRVTVAPSPSSRVLAGCCQEPQTSPSPSGWHYTYCYLVLIKTQNLG